MSDANVIVGPVLVGLSGWAADNGEALASLLVLILIALLDGLKRVGPFTKQAWLIDLVKLGVPQLGQALAGWLKRRRGR